MFSGTSTVHERNNDLDDHQIQRTWDLNKIGNFDEESWTQIFQHLTQLDLANVATVCKQFRTLAENVFKKNAIRTIPHYARDCHNAGECQIHIETERMGWKLLICRFRNCITRIDFSQDFQENRTNRHSEDVLRFMDEFMSESLKSVTFMIDPKQFRNFNFRRIFRNLEELVLFYVNSVDERTVMTTLNRWCPNLKSLIITNSLIRGPHFFLQSLSSLKKIKFNNVTFAVNTECIVDFFSANNQLKEVAIENVKTLDKDMSWLTVLNEQLTGLVVVTWATYTLDSLPAFRQNFANLRSLSFLMARQSDWTCWGVLTNQLLKIINYLPVIELLRVINCSENLMTNNDLVELIGQSSATLETLEITGKKYERELKFGYDLHRQIYGTASRSALCMNFEFGDAFLAHRNWMEGKESEAIAFKVTKDGIWENGKLIVVASKLLDG